MPSFSGGLKMQRCIFAAAIFLTGALQAQATTYDYTGQSFTTFEGLCDASRCTNITGFVSFHIDTSHYSGKLFLSDGDTASLSLGLARDLTASPLSPQEIAFPSYTSWFNH